VEENGNGRYWMMSGLWRANKRCQRAGK